MLAVELCIDPKLRFLSKPIEAPFCFWIRIAGIYGMFLRLNISNIVLLGIDPIAIYESGREIHQQNKGELQVFVRYYWDYVSRKIGYQAIL